MPLHPPPLPKFTQTPYPTRTVQSFSNSKPWITPDIKALLKEKRRAFVSGNKEELKSVQRELRRMIMIRGRGNTTGGRWSTSCCSRTTSVVSGRDLRPSRASRSQSPSLCGRPGVGK
ncbi:hypothetical protein L3Q82_018732 [Scortum barcoo]|uniref:Uncharacterized protein n=1 Tax=Scortum barcoo TaxID=214431 RepID=A0ACB8VFA5_9TELE|nr:hypothetical protein L3Q82_018732 [Scortum barcoo]